MKRYLHNAIVVLRTALRVTVVALPISLILLGQAAQSLMDCIDTKLPGFEEWKP